MSSRSRRWGWCTETSISLVILGQENIIPQVIRRIRIIVEDKTNGIGAFWDKIMKEYSKDTKILSVRVHGGNPVGQKECDCEMILIPLFCFCCHHRCLVMSIFGAWQFILCFLMCVASSSSK